MRSRKENVCLVEGSQNLTVSQWCVNSKDVASVYELSVFSSHQGLPCGETGND